MKFFSKFAVFLLALAMLLNGCKNISSVNSTSQKNHVTEPVLEEPEISIACQYLPKEIYNPQGLPVLRWVCLTDRVYGGGKRTWNEAAINEFNEMLADREIPFRVQFVLLTSDQWNTNLNWFTRPEVQTALGKADLIYGQMTAAEMQEYLLPITEYVNPTDEMSLYQAVPHQLNWLSGTVGDQVYGIRTIPAQARSNGWIVDTALLAECALTEQDFFCDFWEMDEVFQKISHKNGGRPFLYIEPDGLLTTSNTASGQEKSLFPSTIYEYITNIYGNAGLYFGINYAAQTPTVVNKLDTDTVRNIQNAITRYKVAGYTTDNATDAQISYGSLIGERAYIGVNGETCIPVTKAIFKAATPGGYMSGIAINTKYKEQALSLLKLIAENRELAVQLFYGKEGRDYTVENGYYTIKTHGDGTSYSLDFISPLSYFCGMTSNQTTADMRSPGTENWHFVLYDGETLLQSYQRILKASTLACPIIFDYTGYETEAKTIEAVCEKYFYEFSTLTQDRYNQMLQELEDAGSQKIAEALQEQLDQWLSENPDWQ